MEANLRKLEEKLEALQNILLENPMYPRRYYRNKDLKTIFGFSSNTIIKYREEGILPFTFIGDIYLYPVQEVHRVLDQNKAY